MRPRSLRTLLRGLLPRLGSARRRACFFRPRPWRVRPLRRSTKQEPIVHGEVCLLIVLAEGLLLMLAVLILLVLCPLQRFLGPPHAMLHPSTMTRKSVAS